MVVGGLKNIEPKILISLLEDFNPKIQCIFTFLGYDKCIMIQNVMDWPKIDNFSCQIWYLGEISVNTIERHWE